MNKVKTFLLFYEAEICINIACLQSVRNCACLLSIAILLSKQTLSILKIMSKIQRSLGGFSGIWLCPCYSTHEGGRSFLCGRFHYSADWMIFHWSKYNNVKVDWMKEMLIASLSVFRHRRKKNLDRYWLKELVPYYNFEYDTASILGFTDCNFLLAALW